MRSDDTWVCLVLVAYTKVESLASLEDLVRLIEMLTAAKLYLLLRLFEQDFELLISFSRFWWKPKAPQKPQQLCVRLSHPQHFAHASPSTPEIIGKRFLVAVWLHTRQSPILIDEYCVIMNSVSAWKRSRCDGLQPSAYRNERKAH